MQANQKSVIWTVVIATVLLLVAGFFAVSSINNAIVSSEIPTAEAISAAVLAGIVIPDMPELPDYMLSQDEYELKVTEDKAVELALDEVDMSKSFRWFIMDTLNDYEGDNFEDVNVTNYKDIEEIYSVKVEKVNVTGESAVVEIEFKVKYFNDGEFDEEEDELELARLLATITVEYLDFDDDFEDAEVVEDPELKVERIYDN